MTTPNTPVTCYLGSPCRQRDCSYCSSRAADALIESAFSIFWPIKPGRQLLAALARWESAGPLLELRRLTPPRSHIIGALCGERDRLLASVKIRARYVGDFSARMPMLIERDYSFWAWPLGSSAEYDAIFRSNWDSEMMWLREISHPSELEKMLKRILGWRLPNVEKALKHTDEGVRPQVHRVLRTTRSDARILTHNIRRTRENEFLPSALPPVEETLKRPSNDAPRPLPAALDPQSAAAEASV